MHVQPSRVTAMQENYDSLGLSAEDINLIRQYNLTHVLDKIQDQQKLLEEHEQQLEEALSRLENDLEAAREAQMSLLPKELIGVPQIEFKAKFYPSQFVSGDIYNVFRLDENHIGLYHIDISGHGVPAALFSVSLSQMLNTTISRKNLLKVPVTEPPYYKINPPDKVIGILNEDQSFERYGIYFTMVYMIIDIKANTLSYTRAGHNPPLIIRNNGDIETHAAGGFPVGWNFPREDPVVNVQIEPGDRIFLYSDGITEAINEKSELFSEKRLTKFLQETRQLELDVSLDNLIINLQEYTGQKHFDDDVSIVGLSWLK